MMLRTTYSVLTILGLTPFDLDSGLLPSPSVAAIFSLGRAAMSFINLFKSEFSTQLDFGSCS